MSLKWRSSPRCLLCGCCWLPRVELLLLKIPPPSAPNSPDLSIWSTRPAANVYSSSIWSKTWRPKERERDWLKKERKRKRKEKRRRRGDAQKCNKFSTFAFVLLSFSFLKSDIKAPCISSTSAPSCTASWFPVIYSYSLHGWKSHNALLHHEHISNTPPTPCHSALVGMLLDADTRVTCQAT